MGKKEMSKEKDQSSSLPPSSDSDSGRPDARQNHQFVVNDLKELYETKILPIEKKVRNESTSFLSRVCL